MTTGKSYKMGVKESFKLAVSLEKLKANITTLDKLLTQEQYLAAGIVALSLREDVSAVESASLPFTKDIIQGENGETQDLKPKPAKKP